MEENKLTPWEVSGQIDFDKLIEQFGTKKITEELYEKLDKTHPLIRRKTYYSHRDLDKWIADAKSGKTVSVVTGRGPSEKMHLGHLVPFLAAKSMQDQFDCNVFIPISDDEKFYVKQKLSFEDVEKYAEENILDIIALGFNPKKTFIMQDFKYTKIYVYAARVAKHINYSIAKAAFGLQPSHNIGWSFYPAVQAAHILIPQFILGKHRTIVPVGIDQDPFIRLTRDIATHKNFKFEKPGAIHARFVPSLRGDVKMSASRDGVIFLSDDEKEVARKIKKFALSGGQPTIQEHREKGGNSAVDVSFQYLKVFFEHDDDKLKEIEQKYKSGEMLSSEMKQIAIDKINKFLKQHQKRREQAKKQLDKFLLK